MPGAASRAATGWASSSWPRPTGLVERPYYNRFRAWHTGEDWNASRRPRGDVDLGDPIYAIANGKVTVADHFVPSWGNIILIKHALHVAEDEGCNRMIIR